MAQNFMSVAERFGPKTEIIADLRMAPTPVGPENLVGRLDRRKKGR
jgi:hypothetical protein